MSLKVISRDIVVSRVQFFRLSLLCESQSLSALFVFCVKVAFWVKVDFNVKVAFNLKITFYVKIYVNSF